MAEDFNPRSSRVGAAAPRRGPVWWIAASLVITAVIVGVVNLMRPADPVAERVDEIFGEVRQLERSEGRVAETLRSLPGPLSKVGEWLFPQSQEDNYTLAEKIGELGTNALPHVIPRLAGNSSVAVRHVAARSLSYLGGFNAFVVLTNAAARDEAEIVRMAALESLTELEMREAIPVLLRALQTDTNETVRYAAARGLGEIGDASVMPDLVTAARIEGDWDVRAGLADILAEHRVAEAVPVIATWLQVSGETSPAANPVRSAGFTTRVYQVEKIVESLGVLGNEAAFQTLTNFWSTADGIEIRETICTAFGAVGDSRAMPFLRAALDDKNAIRMAAITAMGHLGDTNGLALLLPLIEDPEADVRRAVFRAVGQLGGRAVVPVLLAALDSDLNQEPGLRSALCKILGEIGDPAAYSAVAKAFEGLSKDRAEVIWALGHLGDSNAIPSLVPMLSSESREESFAAAYALVEIGDPAGAAALAADLWHEDEFARHAKACALTMLGGTNGMPTVRTGLNAKEPWRRFGAIIAIARLGLPETSSEWQLAINDRDPALRRLAREASVGRVVPGLVELLQDSTSEYRSYAARGLMFFRDPVSLPALQAAGRDRNAEVQQAARLAAAFIARAEAGR
jgi:HEAT repeat protein